MNIVEQIKFHHSKIKKDRGTLYLDIKEYLYDYPHTPFEEDGLSGLDFITLKCFDSIWEDPDCYDISNIVMAYLIDEFFSPREKENESYLFLMSILVIKHVKNFIEIYELIEIYKLIEIEENMNNENC